MDEKLSLLIKEYKKGKKENIIKIIDFMQPIIKKYVYKLYKDDKEDTYSELVLSILEAISKMNYFGEDKQCMIYLCQAVKNRFFELYRKSKKVNEIEVESNEALLSNAISDFDVYNSLIFKVDLINIVSTFDDKQQKIFFLIVFERRTDCEISEIIHVFRQYVNRVRKQFYKYFDKMYFNI